MSGPPIHETKSGRPDRHAAAAAEPGPGPLLLKYLRRHYHLLILPVAVILTGTVFYRFAEGISLLDAFYMTSITVTTVGFREVTDLSAIGKLFTVALAFVGISTFFVAATQVGLDMVAGAARREQARRERRVERMKDHFIVCGYGRMGRVIVQRLREEGVRPVVVDSDPSMIESLRHDGIDAVMGDATADDTLERAGVVGARGLTTLLAEDSTNVFVTLTARELNPKLFILARANAEEAVPKLYRAGASKVINPYDSAGKRIAQTLMRPAVDDFIEVFTAPGGVRIAVEQIEVEFLSAIAGKALRDTEIRGKANAIVVAIRKPGDEMKFNPSPDTVVEAGDVLVAIADSGTMSALAEMARGPAEFAR